VRSGLQTWGSLPRRVPSLSSRAKTLTATIPRFVRASYHPRRDSPYEVPLPRLPFLDRESVANVQGLGSLPTVRLERRIVRLSAAVMEHLKDSLAFALDIERAFQ
jgi:mRNA-degrading endonuclease toxin of MazEF toxin-antitoxin module